MNFGEQFCPDCHCELCQCDDDPQPQAQTKDSSNTSPDESPAAVGLDPSTERMEAYVKQIGLEPVAWEGAEDWERLAYELCAEEHGEESCNDLLWEGGAIPEPWGERWLKYEGEAKRMIALVTKYHSADTIAALQSLVGEDKLALGKQLAQSNAERQQLQEAVAALQAENAELRKNYNELIMSVGRKFPDETRHQTALRYIQTTETQCIEGPASAAMKEGK